MLKKAILAAVTLVILGALVLTVTFGQNPSLGQEQTALQIVSQRYSIPINELVFVHKAFLKEEGITRIKVVHIPTAQVYVVNLDPQNHEVDDATMQQILAARRSRGFVGKLERALADAARIGDPNELIGVDVWLRPGANPPQIDRGAPEAVRQTQLEAMKNYYAVLRRPIEDFITHHSGQVVYGSQLAPLVHVTVPKSLISSTQSPSFTLAPSLSLAQSPPLQSLPEVDTLYLTRELRLAQHQPIPYHPNLDHSTRAINADNFWSAGFTGNGIKIAVIEIPSGGTGIDYSHTYLKDGIHCHPEDGPLRSYHMTAVAGVIGSTHSTYKGVAFGAPAILSGNARDGFSPEITFCTDWALQQGAVVLNYSVGQQSYGQMSSWDKYLDWIARQNAVTITVAAGNMETGGCDSTNAHVTNPALGWNVLAVGAFDEGAGVGDATDADPKWGNDTMWSGSCWQNPTSDHNDREKPELVAPGVNIHTTVTGNDFHDETGTSFAAPHVAGAAALMLQKNILLLNWPEEIRAILMATAIHNLEGATRLSDKDGAGGVDLASAYTVLNNSWSDHCQCFPSDFPNNVKQITFSASQGQRVRFAIAWDSLAAAPPGPGSYSQVDTLQADFDLLVYDPTGVEVASSSSFDNSYEIVDFTAAVTGTYTAKISKYRFDGTSEFLAWAYLVMGTGGGSVTPALFRVESAGNVFTDGAYFCGLSGSSGPVPPCYNTGSGADIAEHIDVSAPVEPGDVVELDPNNPTWYRRASIPYSSSVAGVISTKPGILMDRRDRDTRPLVALIGRVPVKVTTENGPIHIGDLLTSSAKPGYAMRCSDQETCEGVVIGKAMEFLERGEGLILMLVMR